jgi:hypothetical protein
MPARATWIRTVRAIHLASSMLGLGAMLFFAVSGLVMNHPDRFGIDEAHTVELTIQVPPELLAEPDPNVLREHLVREHGLEGRIQSYEAYDDAITMTLQRPGESSDIEIDRESGEAVVYEEVGNAARILKDLHRGTATSRLWTWLIDAAGALLALACLSGLVLWLLIPRRRLIGLIMLAGGSAVWIVAWLTMLR